MDNEEKFADTGEFAGIGASVQDEADQNGEAAEAGQEAGTQAEGDAGQAEKAGGEPDAGKDGAAAAEGSEPADPDDEPILDFAKVDLGLGEAPVDKEVLAAFGEQCVSLRLTPKQARALCGFQMEAFQKARQRLTSESVQTLQKEWGKDAEANQHIINNLIDRVDEQLGGSEFRNAIEDSGAACYAAFARGLLACAQLVSEDRLGPVSGQNTPARDESAEDGLRAVFAAARGTGR